jgi:D-alanyl-lipoteichoic acid acyltransferase DltB (MBOAT superfamily)
MTFNSFSFLFVFLPAALVVYFALARGARSASWAKAWLLLASLVFYSAARLEYLPLLVGSIGFNYVVAKSLLGQPAEKRSRRFLLIGGIAANVVFLGYFKYAAFLVENLNGLLGTHLALPQMSFPLGISFFTIQQIMFLVDCYEGLVDGHNWLDYFVFVGFFPYVTMGPLVRWKQIVPQMNAPGARVFNADNFARGLFLLVLGLFKKAVLADSFFRWADAGFSYGHPLSLAGGWIAAISFTFQLYFDFSGYTDMAVGAALMLNIAVPQNFDAPFRSLSISEFWRRWHMTLTNFITTYLYTPMLRSMKQVTFAKALMATFLAMAIAGLWHGAAWTFIIFGALHGAALVINQCWKKAKWPMPAPVAWAVTFGFVVVALVFFRAGSVQQAWEMVRAMFVPAAGLFNYEPWSGIDRVDQVTGVGWMLTGFVIALRGRSSLEWQKRFKPSWAAVAVTTAMAAVAILYVNGVVSRSFVYRDF